ncbi:DUF3471 domain-containing protein [Roseivirga sp. E12]|uniref:DUF3471 domain-containing protein n=1 Tax=Roseivirga sp. E12 TaxID=2819237 RepID=UPI001ABC64D3|nr:DUF3471 domain-containing protein [Roseivirga sp. E12]MBO3698559.1 hypothetical protein [Roseivirga sp. E12]
MTRQSKFLFRLFVLIAFTSFAQLATAQTTSSDAHKIENKELKAYVGEYIYDNNSEQGFDITVSMDGGAKLMAQPTNKSQPITLLVAFEEDKFDLTNTGGLKMEFKRNDKKEIVSLTIWSDGHSFTCLRKKGS